MMSRISDVIRKAHHSFCSAVVVAAGNSSRMQQDKLLMNIGGKSVIERSLEALNNSPSIDEIIIVTREDRLEEMAIIAQNAGIDKLSKVVIGGSTRTESALAGVSEANKRAKIICIHDGARPFVTEEIICSCVHQAVLYNAACPAIPVKDTIRLVKDGVAVQTPPREETFAVQTPQAFNSDIIKAALCTAVRDGKTYTDDCAAVEAMGVKIRVVQGSEDNIKVTTPLDIPLAESIAEKRKADNV
ncbi:MAG: 2-C-methyl-D-erythritol 4-phosphate cytidylyltransferase [Ruminococcaceae bacterium]|nr:2-C-methyl-D-erythritol 4-phosphate cytidylyltransferase [Oscillospiraceae bacterium]